MTSESDELHVLLGAYLLGGLSDADHRAFTEHLRTCADCQSELGQLSGLPRLLELARPVDGPHLSPDAALGIRVSGDEDGHVEALLARVARRRRIRRRWLAAVAAAAAVAVFGAGMWLGPRLTAPPSLPTTHVVAAAEPGSGSAVRVDVALVTRGWGTQLDLACQDMPKDGELLLYVIDGKGAATPAASWRATPAGYSRLTGATSLRPDEIRRLEIRDGDGEVLASATT